MANPLKPTESVPQAEEEVLRFWREHDIFAKSLENRKGSDAYIFYDGPPFATGTPHYGHIFVSALKDAVPRYQTMRGKYVPRRWGWDTHGLPIENIVEKDLKISGKKQIEAFGIDRFNEHARSKVLEYVDVWQKTVERIGRWVDFAGSYKTMDTSYIESVWWALGELHKKGLVYEGTRVLPYCPRCETPIANSEIAMDNSYKDISDISVYVRFQLKNQGASLLAWTTTPWTLPGNTALAINPKLAYVEVEYFGPLGVEHLILAKERLSMLGPTDGGLSGQDHWEVIRDVSAKELLGQSYEPLFPYYLTNDFPDKQHAWKIYAADYVSAETGSGVVHLAPAFGEEDMELAKQFNIPALWHVGPDGTFTQEVSDFAGQPVKPKDDHQRTDIELIKYLSKAGLLFKKEKIVHSYPHCFRCETPLYYYAIPAWFVRISDIKDQLITRNADIHWVPDHLKHGRFLKSMEAAPDWNISRNRYWASPLPIWKCGECHETRFVRSQAELKDQLSTRNRFLFMRHGFAEHNTKQINDAQLTGSKLTQKGREQVAAAAAALRTKGITRIVSSPIERCQETARIVAETLGLPHETDNRLTEINTGVFDQQSIASYFAFFNEFSQRWTKRPVGGESYRDVYDRIHEAVLDYNTRHRGETILVISHGDPLWIFLASLEGKKEPHEVESVPYPKQAEPLEATVAEIDLHRPWIDEITLPCGKCAGQMRRIPEVIDCWFESGSMPFAAAHVPFENTDWFQANFPGDFVAEYIAQTRTWFYYMHVLSTVLFDKAPFRHVVTTGTILAEDGQKMSKSKGNYPDPWLLFAKYGVDALRFYLLASPLMRSEDINFSESSVDEVFKKIILRLKNVVSFYELYPDTKGTSSAPASDHLLDRWILARLAELVESVTEAMDAYLIDDAVRPIEQFIDDLSVWYVRRSRERFKFGGDAERLAATQTLRYTLTQLAKVMAPFTPFIAEEIYQKIVGAERQESVHLEDWPVLSVSPDQQKLLSDMVIVRKLVELGHAARSQAGIKVRQPLGKATVTGRPALGDELAAMLRDELNLHMIAWQSSGELQVVLDTTITPALKREGIERELARVIQSLRKDKGLDMTATVTFLWDTDDPDFQDFFTQSPYLKRLQTIRTERQPGLMEGKVEVDGRLLYLLIQD